MLRFGVREQRQEGEEEEEADSQTSMSSVSLREEGGGSHACWGFCGRRFGDAC